MTQLLLRLSCCAGSKKSKANLQRSRESFPLIFKHRRKQTRPERASTLLAYFPKNNKKNKKQWAARGGLRAAAGDVGRRSPPLFGIPVGIAARFARRSRRPGWGARVKNRARDAFCPPACFSTKWGSRGWRRWPCVGPARRAFFFPPSCPSSRSALGFVSSFFYPLAQRETRGGKRSFVALSALWAGGAWFRPPCSEEWVAARGGGKRFEFHRLFFSEADLRKERARILWRFSHFFWESMREVLMPSPVGVVCVGVEKSKEKLSSDP